MEIETELKKLDKELAIKIIAGALKHFSDERKTLAVSATWTDLLGKEPTHLYLIAPP